MIVSRYSLPALGFLFQPSTPTIKKGMAPRDVARLSRNPSRLRREIIFLRIAKTVDHKLLRLSMAAVRKFKPIVNLEITVKGSEVNRDIRCLEPLGKFYRLVIERAFRSRNGAHWRQVI